MNFMEAVKAMKEGKKVRMKRWDKDNYMIIKSGDVCVDSHAFPYSLNLGLIEATDWQIYGEEDNWNLDDKRVTMKNCCECEYRQKDIKTFIQKVKEDFIGTYKEGKPDCICVKHTEIMNKIIDKRTGELK